MAARAGAGVFGPSTPTNSALFVYPVILKEVSFVIFESFGFKPKKKKKFTKEGKSTLLGYFHAADPWKILDFFKASVYSPGEKE